MSETRLAYLLQIYFEGKATEDENDELMSLLTNEENSDKIKTVMDRTWEEYQAKNPVFSAEKSESILAGILKVHSLPAQKKPKQKHWLYAAAAAVLLIGSALIYQLAFKKSGPKDDIVKKPIENIDVAPGRNRAILTLADSSTIILDDATKGELTQQGNTKIIKLDDGQLAYNTAGNTAEVLYNTISIPKGGMYQIVLPDGTKVWLNSASSLRFPTAFVHNERRVELTGEGYFEVVKNVSMPFKVNVAGKGEVEVLGTHFNINSYSDEATINTTLLEGSVKVTGLTTLNSRLIAPGQQAQLNSNGQISLDKNPNLVQIMAWKNGVFYFENSDLQMVMRQLSRWYDVEIVFDGAIPQRNFEGEMQRDLNLSQVLRLLEKNNVHFRIEGKKLIVFK